MKVGAWATPWMRMGVGLLQGLALVLLYEAAEQKAWPSTDGLIFAPALAIAIFIPALVIVGLGNLRPRVLVLWTLAATVLCGGFAFYDIFRAPLELGVSTAVPRITPSDVMVISTAAILFIVHSFIVAAEANGRVIASYPTLFDTSWKHGLQLVLSVGFVAVLWAILFLGAELFRLIRIEFLANLIRRDIFWIPVTVLAFAVALHVTDVRASIVRGARTLALILLSWLLPVMALLVAAFVVMLPFTGLAPLWGTRHAASILLAAAVALVFLINAAYQDGSADNRSVTALRLASLLAAVVMAPLFALAAYALYLRIAQYGLTPERTNALACTVIVGCYGFGYVLAGARSGARLRGLETTNILTAFALVGVLVLLRSPLADPDRISVASQVARLESGQVSPEQFDFQFLRFSAGRYGIEALERLAAHPHGPQATVIAERAGRVLRAATPSDLIHSAPPTITPEQRAANIKVIQPNGAVLPPEFLRQNWNAFSRPWMLPRCLVAAAQCEAVLASLEDGARPDILLFGLYPNVATAFRAGVNGEWEVIGQIANANCPGVLDALRAGRYNTVQAPFKELDVNGQRLRVTTECESAH